METSKLSDNYRMWIEDGILFCEFINEVTIETIIQQEKDAVSLLKSKNIQIIPNVAIVNSVPTDQIKMGIGSISKLFSSVDALKYYSGIWVVGSDPQLQNLGKVANKFFFKNRLKFVSTVEQAKKEALASIGSQDSILTTPTEDE